MNTSSLHFVVNKRAFLDSTHLEMARNCSQCQRNYPGGTLASMKRRCAKDLLGSMAPNKQLKNFKINTCTLLETKHGKCFVVQMKMALNRWRTLSAANDTRCQIPVPRASIFM